MVNRVAMPGGTVITVKRIVMVTINRSGTAEAEPFVFVRR